MLWIYVIFYIDLFVVCKFECYHSYERKMKYNFKMNKRKLKKFRVKKIHTIWIIYVVDKKIDERNIFNSPTTNIVYLIYWIKWN